MDWDERLHMARPSRLRHPAGKRVSMLKRSPLVRKAARRKLDRLRRSRPPVVQEEEEETAVVPLLGEWELVDAPAPTTLATRVWQRFVGWWRSLRGSV